MFGTDAAFLMAISSIAAVFAAWGGVMATPVAATIIATAADAVTAVEAAKIVVMENSILRLFCFLGSVGGAWASVALFPRAKDDTGSPVPMSAREISGKFTVSIGAGTALTPMFMQWANWPLNADWCMGTAFLMALFFWTVAQFAVPVLSKLGVKFASDKAARILTPPGYKDNSPP